MKSNRIEVGLKPLLHRNTIHCKLLSITQKLLHLKFEQFSYINWVKKIAAHF